MTDPCDFANNNFNNTFAQEDYSIFENCSMENVSSNSSDFNFASEKTVQIVFQFLLYFMASIGNCLLLFVMYRDPLKRFRNSTSYFIINLTLADLLSTASGISETVMQLNPPVPTTGDIPINYKITGCVSCIGIECSLLMIMVFTLDRYVAIAHAFRYNNFFGKRYIAVTAIIISWCFAIVSLPVMYFASLADNIQDLLTRVLASNFIALCFVTLTLHPYTHWVFSTRIHALRNSSANHKQLLEENLKVAKVLATTVLAVSLCSIFFSLPYFIAFCFYNAKCDSCFLSEAFQSFWKFFSLCPSARVMVNTLLYAWRLPLYRKSLIALCAFGNWTTPLHGVRKTVSLGGNQASKTSLKENGAVKNLSTNNSSANHAGLLNMAYNTAETSN